MLSSSLQEQAQPAPHPPATGAPHTPPGAPAGSVALPVVAKTGSSRRAPGWPPGQTAGASASAMDRRSSKMV